ncbi:hypothetical protein Acor_72230 [Acrocarpospora corrugata]|uniref:Uncharacterized protein n=1 Tax=Acrocarpospora corrugata TaxID=35763 RepID=A0A5M3W7W9_9ACTN|nr:hypothetical protein Acor_72230 [Acrocarpospora corrugata]
MSRRGRASESRRFGGSRTEEGGGEGEQGEGSSDLGCWHGGLVSSGGGGRMDSVHGSLPGREHWRTGKAERAAALVGLGAAVADHCRRRVAVGGVLAGQF